MAPGFGRFISCDTSPISIFGTPSFEPPSFEPHNQPTARLYVEEKYISRGLRTSVEGGDIPRL